MKYRLDFITNSSSSSFILGKPNGNTVTVDDAWKFIKDSAAKILSTINYLDNEVYKISGLDCDLRKFRDGDDDVELESRLIHKLEKLFSFKRKVKSQFGMCGINVQDDIDKKHDIYYFYFLCYYIDNSEIEWLKRIANGDYGQLEAVDFRESIDDYDVRIEEMLDWYSDIVWDESAKSLNPRELAHKYLGEVALVGDDPCMPTLLADFLFAKLKYASMHMG